ncbi:DUF5686 family protein [Flavobacterium sp. NKUCC04_CG]|uniref:DUF5686 family protein n=1 Tax=Flavobacterium sp. NKUCC04_CG TaxID=2842121 RepID=UPI001C5A956C|nr:DUF5686 family protein [Flavobacterium sp. NKUCC04_CG]MBW3517810.1 DUF5686 and carboxypeptidase regulatory-like domain-containing protein [Flavobacterium sp. NKUCC04_CG]
MKDHYYLTTLLIFFLVVFSSSLHAQPFYFSGQVVDGQNQEPLAFATIVFNQNQQWAVMTDIDGHFNYYASQPITAVSSSFIGYTTVTATVSATEKNIRIAMQPSTEKLQELIIPLSENPAHRIMKEVLANKAKNNPEKIAAFQYTSYNKMVMDIKSQNSDDTIKLKELFKGGNLFLMESVTERKFLAPDWNEEVVKATRVSGLKNPTFAALATDLQPFSFYDDNIKLFDLYYLNPISKGSLSKYKFVLEDSWSQGSDTIHLISYKPLANKNFEGLQGVLYINTNTYAIQNVIATPFEKGKMDIKIQQQYVFLDNTYWFPQQLNYTVTMLASPSVTQNIVMEGKSYIDGVQFDVPLQKRDFGRITVRMDENASQQDSAFWNRHRVLPLQTAEIQTYMFLDSIGHKYKFDQVLNGLDKFSTGKIGFKYVDLDITKMLIYNEFEGFRLGLGAYTNEDVFKNLSFGGFIGYGLKDYRWKYGFEGIYKISPIDDFTIGAKYQNNLVEVGNHGFEYSDRLFGGWRGILAYRMDKIEESSVTANFRMLLYGRWRLSLSNSKISPLYDFDQEGGSFRPYTNTQFSVNFRYAYKEKLVNTGKRNVSMGTVYPVIHLSYYRGLDGLLDGSLKYNKFEAAVEQSFFVKNLGKSTYRLEGGYIDSPLPYGLLFTGEGSYDKDLPYLITNTFQTMRPYEFLSDTYVSVFTSHEFGSLLFKTGKFQPQIALHNNLSWGNLTKSTSYLLMPYRQKDQVFMETGLQLGNLISMNYLNIGSLGLGIGVFYRYGPTAYPGLNDNVALKLAFNFSVK